MWQARDSILVGEGIGQDLKHSMHERRPDGSGSDSFPSGHAAVSFAAAATIHRRYGWEVGLPATIVSTFVASRSVLIASTDSCATRMLG
jgi:membrane-associated phospholipid phosphatase